MAHEMSLKQPAPPNELGQNIAHILSSFLKSCLTQSTHDTVPQTILLDLVRVQVPQCTPDELFTALRERFSSVRKLTHLSEVLFSGLVLKMCSLQSLTEEWEADNEKPVYTRPGSEQSRWSLVMANADFHKWVLYCSEHDIREIMVYRNMSWKVWCRDNVIKNEVFPESTLYFTTYSSFKNILKLVQACNICTGIPQHTPKRRCGAPSYSTECEHVIVSCSQTVCQACSSAAEDNERSSEVVELDGRVSKVTESIETLQETIHGVKMELEQLRRDHCAIMQYLLHLPQAQSPKSNNFHFPSKPAHRTSHNLSNSLLEMGSPDEVVNTIAMAIQSQSRANGHIMPSSSHPENGDRKGAVGDGKEVALSEFDDIMHFGDDISIAKSQLYSIITKARNCAHPQTKLITMLVKNLIPEYEGKSYTRLDPSHTSILRSLYFTVFPVEVDENVVDDDIRGRIKSRIEEEIWQKLKVTITDCCRKAKPKLNPSAAPGYYASHSSLPTHVNLQSVPTLSRSISPNLTQALNSHILSSLSHQSFTTSSSLAMSTPSSVSMVSTIKTEPSRL